MCKSVLHVRGIGASGSQRQSDYRYDVESRESVRVQRLHDRCRNGRASRASCLKRLPTRSATRSTIRCSNTSISLRPWLRKCVAGNTPGRAADTRWATRKAAPSNARALDHGRRHQFADQRRRLVFLAQAGIAVEHRQRDKGAALMADRAEIAVGDQVQRLLAAIVGMHPPSDIRQQAGGVAQPAVFVGFAQLDDPDQPIGPSDQFLRRGAPIATAVRSGSARRRSIRPWRARCCGSIS